MAYTDYPTVTIADGQSLSGAHNLETHVLCGVIVPSGWTTAALTFQGSYDGTNYFNLYDGASELSFAAIAASSWVILDPAKFLGIRHVKVRSGTAGTPVNQAGGDNLILISRKI